MFAQSASQQSDSQPAVLARGKLVPGGNRLFQLGGGGWCLPLEEYLEEQDKRKKAPASRQPPKTSSSIGAAAGGGAVPSTNPAFPPGWGGSYARVAASGSGTSPGQANVTGDDLFTLPEFFALAGEMLTRFRACRNKAEQFQALSELMMKYIYNG